MGSQSSYYWLAALPIVNIIVVIITVIVIFYFLCCYSCIDVITLFDSICITIFISTHFELERWCVYLMKRVINRLNTTWRLSQYPYILCVYLSLCLRCWISNKLFCNDDMLSLLWNSINIIKHSTTVVKFIFILLLSLCCCCLCALLLAFD